LSRYFPIWQIGGVSFSRMTAEELRAHRETVLLRLLLRTSQLETNTLVARLHDQGHGTVQRTWIGVLANIDTEGTRVTTIASRMGTTRQAVSQLVQAIEAAGFLERSPDPDDRRAVLIRHTRRGRALLVAALEAMADIEAGYERVIGPNRMRALKKALTDIADALDPRSALREP
jgi:DNA-binding MarR family transcriptional regulator